MTADLSALRPDLRESVVKHLVHEDHAQFVLAQIEQAKLAKFYQDNASPARKGLGPMTAVIHTGLKNHLAARYGTETVYSDPDFTPWLLKRHDEFRVKETRAKIGIGWTPEMEVRKTKDEGRKIAPRPSPLAPRPSLHV